MLKLSILSTIGLLSSLTLTGCAGLKVGEQNGICFVRGQAFDLEENAAGGEPAALKLHYKGERCEVRISR